MVVCIRPYVALWWSAWCSTGTGWTQHPVYTLLSMDLMGNNPARLSSCPCACSLVLLLLLLLVLLSLLKLMFVLVLVLLFIPSHLVQGAVGGEGVPVPWASPGGPLHPGLSYSSLPGPGGSILDLTTASHSWRYQCGTRGRQYRLDRRMVKSPLPSLPAGRQQCSGCTLQ